MNDAQRTKRLARIRKESTGPVRSITVKALHGESYTVSKQGRMFTISRPTPDGHYVHRLMASSRDALKIADAIVDLHEHDATS